MMLLFHDILLADGKKPFKRNVKNCNKRVAPLVRAVTPVWQQTLVRI